MLHYKGSHHPNGDEIARGKSSAPLNAADFDTCSLVETLVGLVRETTQPHEGTIHALK
jgi:hypothetical protein